jgi:hypothetical protein
MSRYRPRTQGPPPPPNSGYRPLKETQTSGTTDTARRPDSTKVPMGGDDGFIPIKQSAAPRRRRPPKRNAWSKKDVVEVVGILVALVTVIGSAMTLNFKLNSVGDKVTSAAGDVTTVKETQIADHTKLEEVRTDVIELRRDVQDLRSTPGPAPSAPLRTGKPKAITN